MKTRLPPLLAVLGLLAHGGITAQGRGSAVLTVTVTDDHDRPIPRARVDLSERRVCGLADEQGRIEFTGLGEDSFRVSAHKEGYVSAVYGTRLSIGQSIELRPSERLSIRLRLDRVATLAGAVTTDRGESASEARVTARRWEIEDGVMVLADGDTIGTDQYGRFRFHDLEPGLYVVIAEVASPWRDEGVRRAGGRDAAIVRVDLFGSVPAAVTSAAPDGLRLSAGQELSGVQILLTERTIRTATIEGRLVVPYKVENQTEPRLRRLDPAPTSSDLEQDWIEASLDPDGRFVFRNVPTGRYRLSASWVDRRDERSATQDIDVAGESISGITLVPRRGSTVSGRMVVPELEDGPADLSKVSFLLENEDESQSPRMHASTMDRDGRFRFASVPPGRYRFGAFASDGYDHGGRSWPLSVTINGVDAIDRPFEVTAGRDVADIVVTLSAEAARITGAVLGPGDTPAPNALVVAFSTDRRYWLPNSRRVALDVPNSQGRYALSNLPPGEYWVGVCLNAPAEGEWDTALLEALVPGATKITLARREERALSLRVVGK